MTENDDVFQPAGNYYDKYRTRNPVARALMNGFLRSFSELAAIAQADDGHTGLEIGCGEAELSIRLASSGWRMRGCDVAPAAVQEAKQRVAAAGLDIAIERRGIEDCHGLEETYDLVVCCEVMEHLENSEAALDTLCALSRRYVLVSVPREPVWRVLNMARGRYLSDFGNTPGHIQHWSRPEFLRLLQTKLDVVAVRSPLPWTQVLCRVRCASTSDSTA